MIEKNRNLKVTMAIESGNGDKIELVSNFKDYIPGDTEDNIIYQFSKLISCSTDLCETLIEDRLGVHFNVRTILND